MPHTRSGDLARTSVASLLYRLALDGLDGTLTVAEGGRRHGAQLRRGILRAVVLEGEAPRPGPLDGEPLGRSGSRDDVTGRRLRLAGGTSDGALEDALRRQAEARLVRLVAVRQGSYAFVPERGEPRPEAGGLLLAIVPWLLRTLGTRSAPLAPRRSYVLAPGCRPPDEWLAPDERRLVAALLLPRRLEELMALAIAPRPRVLALLRFLEGVGALGAPPAAPLAWTGELPQAEDTRPIWLPALRAEELRARAPRSGSYPALASAPSGAGGEPRSRSGSYPAVARPAPPAPAAYVTLGLAPGATDDEVRVAFRRLARDLHPDRHPDATQTTRRVMAARLAAVSAAYRTLLAR